jgi:hypothetical protein
VKNSPFHRFIKPLRFEESSVSNATTIKPRIKKSLKHCISFANSTQLVFSGSFMHFGSYSTWPSPDSGQVLASS